MRPFDVDSPCHEDWNAMRRGAGPARHCAACVERVYDLAAMTASEITGLAILKGGSFCGRQVIDRARDQLVVRPPPHPRARRSLFDWRNVARSAAFAGSLAVAACDVAPASASPLPVPVQVDRDETPPPAPAPSQPGPAQPEPERPREVRGKIAWSPPPIDRDIAFALGSASLGAASKRVLDSVAAALTRDPSMELVTIVGHASEDEARPDKGAALALKRATAVRRYLVAKGIAPARLAVAGGAIGEPIVEVRERPDGLPL